MIIRKKYLTSILCFFLIAAATVLFLFPGISAKGAYNGIINCLETLIPSLFPFMTLTLFLTESGLYQRIFKIPASVLARLTGISSNYCSLFLLGMIGGYPSAAKNISTMCKKGEISEKTAEILICFCTNAGPSFLISAVGQKMFLSQSIGIILYVSSLLSSFSLMFIYGKYITYSHNASNKTTYSPLSVSLVKAVSGSCNAMTMICSFVILFSVIISFIPDFSQNNLIYKAMFLGIFEVTSASICASYDISLLNILIVSAICGWSGICIIFQISAICSQAKISIKRFIGSRILCALFNILYTYLLLLAIPIKTTQTFISNAASASPAIFSAPLPAFMLLVCCVTFPICLKNRKKF